MLRIEGCVQCSWRSCSYRGCHGYLCGFFWASGTCALLVFPPDQFQIQHDEGVEDGNQTQRHEGRNREAADLRVTKWLPKRAAVRSQREQRNHRSRHGNHDRSKTKDARIDECQLQVLTLFSSLLDEFEEHDDMAHDDTDETD